MASREPPGREPQSRRWGGAGSRRRRGRSTATRPPCTCSTPTSWRESAHGRHAPAWEATHAAALACAAGNWNGSWASRPCPTAAHPASAPSRSGGRFHRLPPLTRLAPASYQGFVFLRDDTPPAILYLAILRRRRALAANPDDAQAHLVLGESYLRLIQSTREAARVRQMPECFNFVCAEASAALNQAVVLRPTLAQAHRSLGQLYVELGYLDLASKHYRTSLDRIREAGPPRGVTGEQFRQQLARAEEELAPVAQVEQEQVLAYANESSGLRVLERATARGEEGTLRARPGTCCWPPTWPPSGRRAWRWNWSCRR